jgi:hypothetical protein
MPNSLIYANFTPTQCAVIVQPLQYSVEHTAAAKSKIHNSYTGLDRALKSLSASPRALTVTNCSVHMKLIKITLL